MGQRETARPETKRAPAKPEERQIQSGAEEDCIDQASEDSFPASDPPSYTPVTHSGRPKRAPVKQKRRH